MAKKEANHTDLTVGVTILPGTRMIDVPVFIRATGISRSTTWQLIREGRIRTVRVGRRCYVPVSELDRIAENGLAS